MIVCEFCSYYLADGKCKLGLNIPKGMSCREFVAGLAKFCADPKDFVDPGQIMQMAAYFGFQKMELKKIKLMATREHSLRS